MAQLGLVQGRRVINRGDKTPYDILVAEVGQSSLDSVVAPRRVRLGHAKYQFLDRRLDGRTSRFVARIRPLPRDELTVPAKDGIRSDQSRHFVEQFPAKLLSLGRQAAALLVAQVERAAQLLAENAVLFLKVFKDLLLFPVEPTRQEADKEDMWRDEQVHGKHGSRSHLRLQNAASRVSAQYGGLYAGIQIVTDFTLVSAREFATRLTVP